MTNLVASVSIVDHGIDNSQYFQGHGVSHTDWDDCATGCGNNFQEALDDALEMISQSTDGDIAEQVEKMVLADNGWHELSDAPIEPSVSNDGEFEGDLDETELHYYVSIDWKYEREPANG